MRKARLFAISSVLLLIGLSCQGPSERVIDTHEYPNELADIRIRDPFIYVDREAKRYYLYAQTGNRRHEPQPGLGVEVYTSPDLLHWSDAKLVFQRPESFWGGEQIWAPEVHEIGGTFYMFVTFNGRAGGRGTQILHAQSPEGPFEMLGPNANTPPEETALDGTPWIDEEGQRWLVYCHEWVQIGDGAVKAVRMSEDFSRRIGEPMTLFHASDAPWVRHLESSLRPGDGNYITDGPWFYSAQNGTLLMLWSSFGEQGYAVGIAVSESGRLDGPWTQQPEPLFAQDGGHTMVFTTLEGQQVLTLHQPNGGGNERAHFFQIEERNGTLVLSGEWRP